MAKKITLNKNGLLMWRLGTLDFKKQDKWDRAPRSKGMWAFPHPYYEPFFTDHQYDQIMPKRFKTDPQTGIPYAGSLCYSDEKYKDVPVDITDVKENPAYEHEIATAPFIGPHGYVDYNWPEDLWLQREEWIKTVGKKQLPLRKFYWDGYVYCHFPKHGKGALELNEWQILHIEELAKAIKRNQSTPLNGRTVADYDAFEVFLARDMGKIKGNLKK